MITRLTRTRRRKHSSWGSLPHRHVRAIGFAEVDVTDLPASARKRRTTTNGQRMGSLAPCWYPMS